MAEGVCLDRKVLMILLIAVSIFCIAAAYYYLGSHKGSSITCSENSIVYVYSSQKQKEKAEKFFETFKQLAAREGLNLSSVETCVIDANSLSRKLRMYPALMYRGKVSGLEQITVGEIDGYHIVDYMASLNVARYAGIEPTFTYEAKAFIVSGSSPWSRPSVDVSKMKSELERLALAKITDVVEVGVEDSPVEVDVAPALIFESTYNLSEGVQYLEKTGNNYYMLLKAYNVRLAQDYLGAEAAELRKLPAVLSKDLPSLGSQDAPVRLYIFEDYLCPYCAKFYKDCYDHLVEKAKAGLLQVVAVDFIVHREVLDAHALTRCLYAETSNGSLYFQISDELYLKYYEGVSPTLQEAVTIAAEYVSNDTLARAKACMLSEREVIYNLTLSAYYKIGIGGTPTLLFWERDKKVGLLFTGYIPWSQVEEVVDWLSGD